MRIKTKQSNDFQQIFLLTCQPQILYLYVNFLFFKLFKLLQHERQICRSYVLNSFYVFIWLIFQSSSEFVVRLSNFWCRSILIFGAFIVLPIVRCCHRDQLTGFCLISFPIGCWNESKTLQKYSIRPNLYSVAPFFLPFFLPFFYTVFFR